jgi:L-threonylcarbamoyladenylate synthase
MNRSEKSFKKVSRILKSGGIGVMPTDTIYGLVGSALCPETVRRIYKVRQRNLKKPCIVLIGDVDDMGLLGISLTLQMRKLLNKHWPGRVSIILPCREKRFTYLHRGMRSLAFRLPKDRVLRNLLKKTGPLVAPSANLEGSFPAISIRQAREYFGDAVDFYVDGGKVIGKPSALIQYKNGKLLILRK